MATNINEDKMPRKIRLDLAFPIEVKLREALELIERHHVASEAMTHASRCVSEALNAVASMYDEALQETTLKPYWHRSECASGGTS